MAKRRPDKRSARRQVQQDQDAEQNVKRNAERNATLILKEKHQELEMDMETGLRVLGVQELLMEGALGHWRNMFILRYRGLYLARCFGPGRQKREYVTRTTERLQEHKRIFLIVLRRAQGDVQAFWTGVMEEAATLYKPADREYWNVYEQRVRETDPVLICSQSLEGPNFPRLSSLGASYPSLFQANRMAHAVTADAVTTTETKGVRTALIESHSSMTSSDAKSDAKRTIQSEEEDAYGQSGKSTHLLTRRLSDMGDSEQLWRDYQELRPGSEGRRRGSFYL